MWDVCSVQWAWLIDRLYAYYNVIISSTSQLYPMTCKTKIRLPSTQNILIYAADHKKETKRVISCLWGYDAFIKEIDLVEYWPADDEADEMFVCWLRQEPKESLSLSVCVKVFSLHLSGSNLQAISQQSFGSHSAVIRQSVSSQSAVSQQSLGSQSAVSKK